MKSITEFSTELDITPKVLNCILYNQDISIVEKENDGFFSMDIYDNFVSIYNKYLDICNIDIYSLRQNFIPLDLINESIVYFLFNGLELVYVGQSRKVLARLCNHSENKKFDGIGFLKIKPADLDIVEMLFINKFSPRYNQQNDKELVIRNILKKSL